LQVPPLVPQQSKASTLKAYLVTESETLDRAAVESYSAVLGPAMQAAGGHFIGGGTGSTKKITAVVGNPPKRFGVSEFGSAYAGGRPPTTHSAR